MYNIFYFKDFEQLFGIYIRIEILKHPNYKNNYNETKYLNTMRKTRLLKVKNSLLE